MNEKKIANCESEIKRLKKELVDKLADKDAEIEKWSNKWKQLKALFQVIDSFSFVFFLENFFSFYFYRINKLENSI